MVALAGCTDDGSADSGDGDTQGTSDEVGEDEVGDSESESGTTESGETDSEGESDSEDESESDTGEQTGGDDPCEPTDWDPAEFDAVYEVGPGQNYEDPSAVPWEQLSPGSLIRIHWRDEPYRDKWVINTAGTEDAPIVVVGVPEGGSLPVITGDGAQTRPQLDYWNEQRGLIKIGGASSPGGDTASWIYIENLDLRGASATHQFTNAGGGTDSYADNAAALYVEWGDSLHFRNNEISGSGNGIFTGSQSADVVVACNYVHDNGVVDSIYEHNSYTESDGITFEFNHYGPLCDGCPGNNLKDRSAGTLIRYNWIEAGNRQLDLVESDHDELVALPEYAVTRVYGNILVEPDGAGNSQMIHYGGDLGDPDYYRKGTLELYSNTFVSTRAGNTTWMRLSTNGETCDARNNVVYATAGGSSLAMTGGSGALELRNNWISEGWVDTHDALEGSISDMGGNAVGGEPGFTDLDQQDFRPADGSPLLDSAGALADGADAVNWQYREHAGGEPRADGGEVDVGAYGGAE